MECRDQFGNIVNIGDEIVRVSSYNRGNTTLIKNLVTGISITGRPQYDKISMRRRPDNSYEEATILTTIKGSFARYV